MKQHKDQSVTMRNQLVDRVSFGEYDEKQNEFLSWRRFSVQQTLDVTVQTLWHSWSTEMHYMIVNCKLTGLLGSKSKSCVLEIGQTQTTADWHTLRYSPWLLPSHTQELVESLQGNGLSLKCQSATRSQAPHLLKADHAHESLTLQDVAEWKGWVSVHMQRTLGYC